MNQDGGEKYVTHQTLHEKLDTVYEELGDVRERLARVETWLKIGPGIIALAVTFGPHVAQAFT